MQRPGGSWGTPQGGSHGLSHGLCGHLLLLLQHLAPVAGIKVVLRLALLPPQLGQLPLLM